MMLNGLVFGWNVLLLSFSVMIVTVETILFLFRNSISFHIQNIIRRYIPFISGLTVIGATILRGTTDPIYVKMDMPLANVIASTNTKVKPDIMVLVLITYFIITAILVLQYTVRYILYVISIKRSTDITLQFNDSLGERRIKVYSWEKAKTPFCFGTISKCIVFPENYTFGLGYALKHEISHCDNNDPLTINVAKIMTLLMWFNPIAYLYYQQVRIGCEYACDERVVKNLSFDEKKKYTEVILASTQRERSVFAGATLATEKTLKSRFKNVLTKQKINSRKSIVISSAIVLAVAVIITIVAVLKIPEQRAKYVKISYSSEQEVKKEVYYEEYIDGKWFRGELHFDSIEDLDYGVKSAKYSGILHEGE